jgi:cytochrome c-type biogenesis protein
MTLLILSFVAGILTVAAPCILPLLPVIVGGSLASSNKEARVQWYRPVVVAGSLAISVIIFTLLLKASTILLGIPQLVWQVLSGTIVILLGLSFLIPSIWEKVALKTGLYLGSNSLLTKSFAQKGVGRDVLIGASLGPVFSSCSPTYALIVATVLPASFITGFVYIIAYAIGMAGTLLAIAFLGQALVSKLGWLSNPAGWLHKTLGVVFIIVGLSVIFGLDKSFQAFILDQGWYDPISRFEQSIER